VINKFCNVGDQVRCTGTLAQTNGNAIDATTVKAWYKTPAGTVTTLTYPTDGALVKDGIGAYHFDLDLDSAGRYYYGFFSLGTGKAASADGEILVAESKRS